MNAIDNYIYEGGGKYMSNWSIYVVSRKRYLKFQGCGVVWGWGWGMRGWGGVGKGG